MLSEYKFHEDMDWGIQILHRHSRTADETTNVGEYPGIPTQEGIVRETALRRGHLSIDMKDEGTISQKSQKKVRGTMGYLLEPPCSKNFSKVWCRQIVLGLHYMADLEKLP